MAEEQVEKLYYSISDIEKMFDVSPSLIRFWEKQFKQLNPRKTKGGTRKYSKSDIEIFSLIYQLVKVQGYTLDGAKEKLKILQLKPSPNAEVIDTLNNLKLFLNKLKNNIQ